jgi:uncharacterized protein with NRDE domain
VLAANRDEFYNRPARHLAYWDDAPHILAGRDLKARGTWMGITRTGRFAAITNYREAGLAKDKAPSRGNLTRDFLIGHSTPRDYLKTVQAKGQAYNGFNLIIGDEKDLLYYANRDGSIRNIKPGVHGLSNHFLDAPWPKVNQGTRRLHSLLIQKKDFSPENIFEILADRSVPLDEELPDTGVGLEWERILSPMFIKSDTYGTRCSSILLWKYTGEITFMERTFGRQDGKTGATTQCQTFSLSL